MSNPKRGRPRKPAGQKFRNVQAQFGRHPQEEVDLIDEAARMAGLTRSAWAWAVLMRAAKRKLRENS